jgi:predicted metal-dependent phosphoesterase TrpH
VRHYAPDPVEAVRLVRAAGGVPVMAHPRARHRGRIVEDSVIEEMVDAGLMGLEIGHRDNPPADQEDLRLLSRRWGLLVTGSSDYHADGKPNRLGENTTAPEVLDEMLARATGSAMVR